jgi:ParB family chromosome partitioning protein
MVMAGTGITIRQIPIDRVIVENPRERSEKSFKDLVESISKVGLKKPITVTIAEREGGSEAYLLVCGQGRMEAYASLGQAEIPAIIMNASEEDRMLRSVVENIARRQHRPLELLHDIGALKERGYSDHVIAQKTGLTYAYVHEIGQLIQRGEKRLLLAVETGKMPLSVALDIAKADDAGVQDAFSAAYTSGQLKGKKLLAARRLVERRHRLGKHQKSAIATGAVRTRMTSEALVGAYRRETERQREMVRKAEIVQSQLMIITAAFRTLLSDENFGTLLRAEGLETMPAAISDSIQGEGL